MGILDRLLRRTPNTERTPNEHRTPNTQRIAAVESFFNREGYLINPARSFAGLMNQFSRVYSDRWDEALRHWPANAVAMENDAYFSALMEERTGALRRWKWQIEHIDDPDQKKNPEAETIRKQLGAIITRTHRLNEMRDYLREAVWYGRYGSQLQRERQTVGGFSRWVVKAHTPIHGDSLRLDWDNNWCVAINSMDMSRYGEEATTTDRMPVLRLSRADYRQRFIVHRRRVRAGSYFYPETAGKLAGVGIRHQVYWAWWLRDEMLASAVAFLDKVGTMGLFVVYYEEGNKKSQESAEKTARDASRRNAIAVPRPANNSSRQTAGIELIPANMGGVQFLTQFIGDYFERHIERLIVGQSLSAGTEGGGLGGTGVAGLHANTKFNLLASDAEDLDATYTSDLVQPTLDLNFPESGFSYVWRHVLPDPDADKKLEAVTRVSSGVDFVKDEVRGLTGMSKPEEGDEIFGGNSQGSGPDGGIQPGNPGLDGGEGPDELEAIAQKMESGEELTPEEQSVVDGLVNNSSVGEESYSEWEAPSDGRRNWRRKRADGRYEYRKSAPTKNDRQSDTQPSGDENKRSASERIRTAKQGSAPVQPVKLASVDAETRKRVEESLGANWKQYAEMRATSHEQKTGEGRAAESFMRLKLKTFSAQQLVDLLRVHSSSPKDGFGEWASTANEFLQAIAIGFNLKPGVVIDATDATLGVAINAKLTASASPESKMRPGDRAKFVDKYKELRENELVYGRVVLVTNGKPEQNGLYVFYNWQDGTTQFGPDGDGITKPKRLCSVEDYYTRAGEKDFQNELRSKLELSRSEHKKLRKAMEDFVLSEIEQTAQSVKGAADTIRQYGGDAKAAQFVSQVADSMFEADEAAAMEAVAKRLGVTVEALKALQKPKQ
jgi:phage gp29-like protein/tellurite resistance protein